MALFDLFRRKAAGGPGTIAYLNPVLNEGGILLEDGREIFFEAAACLGFWPLAGQTVVVAAVVTRGGKPYATRLHELAEDSTPDAPPAAAPPPSRASRASAHRHPELEAALLREPYQAEAHLVYGDWLQARGDPRGELIALQHRLSERPEDTELARAERYLLEQHADVLLGELARHQAALALEWRLGFIRSARICGPVALGRDAETRASGETILRALLAHPSALLLEALSIGILPSDEAEPLTSAVEALVEAGPRPALRSLFLGDFVYPDELELSWATLPSTERLYPLYPRLAELTLQAGHLELGRVELPALRSFEVRTGGLARASLEAILAARWPELERLVIWFGDPNYGAQSTLDDLRPLLAGTELLRGSGTSAS